MPSHSSAWKRKLMYHLARTLGIKSHRALGAKKGGGGAGPVPRETPGFQETPRPVRRAAGTGPPGWPCHLPGPSCPWRSCRRAEGQHSTPGSLLSLRDPGTAGTADRRPLLPGPPRALGGTAAVPASGLDRREPTTAIALLRGQSGVESHVCWSAQPGLWAVLGSDAKSTLHHLATPVKIPKRSCLKMGKNHAASLQVFVRNATGTQ